MFNRTVLGRPTEEKLDNNWTVRRYDKRDNSACRKWQSELTGSGDGCRAFEVNLDGYDENKWIEISISIDNIKNIERFRAEFTKFSEKIDLTPSLKVRYSYNFPRDIILENIPLKYAFKIVGALVDLINKINIEISPHAHAILPKQVLEKEAKFIVSCVADSATQIKANLWRNSSS